MKTKYEVKSISKNLVLRLHSNTVRQTEAGKMGLKKIGTILYAIGAFSACFALSDAAAACNGPNCGGGGTARRNVMLESFVRKNSIRKSSPEFTECANIAVKKVGERLPGLGARMQSALDAKRYVLVPEAELEKVIDNAKDLVNRHGDKLVAVNPKDSPFVWVSEEFYQSPEMQNVENRCDLILHENTVTDFLNTRGLRTDGNLSDADKDAIVGAAALIADLVSESPNMSAGSLQNALVHMYYPEVGLTKGQTAKLALELFTQLNNNILVNPMACNGSRNFSVTLFPNQADSVYERFGQFWDRKNDYSQTIARDFGIPESETNTIRGVYEDIAKRLGISYFQASSVRCYDAFFLYSSAEIETYGIRLKNPFVDNNMGRKDEGAGIAAQ